MDNELFQRFLSGDQVATTGVKNHLRAITSRVLAAPQWGLSGIERTRDLEIQAAKEAMTSPGETVLSCATGALLASTRLGLIALREREALPKGHPDAITVAREVVGVLGEPERGALLEHLENCGTCSRHLEMAKGAVNAAMSASAAQTSSVKAKEQLATSAPTSSTSAKAPHEKTRAHVKKRKEKKKDAKRAIHPDLLKKERFSIVSSLGPLVILILILGYFGFMRSIETDEERVRRLAHLLAPELPPTALADQLDPSSRGAALDMERGHCDSASSRLSAASDSNPSDPTLNYYAGLAHLCARHPEESLRHFERLGSLDVDPFYGQEWWYTQVLILNDRVDEARARLSIMVEDQATRHQSAALQLARLDEQ